MTKTSRLGKLLSSVFFLLAIAQTMGFTPKKITASFTNTSNQLPKIPSAFLFAFKTSSKIVHC